MLTYFLYYFSTSFNVTKGVLHQDLDFQFYSLDVDYDDN